ASALSDRRKQEPPGRHERIHPAKAALDAERGLYSKRTMSTASARGEEREGSGRAGGGDPAQGGGAEGRRAHAGRDPAATELPEYGPDADGGQVGDPEDPQLSV